MLKKIGKFLYEKEMFEIRSIVEYLHFKVVSVFSVIPWFIIILDKRNSAFYPMNSKEKFWDSFALLLFFLIINMIFYIIVGHITLKYIKKIKTQPKKESETSWKKIWENNQDIDVELRLEDVNNDNYPYTQLGKVFGYSFCNSLLSSLAKSGAFIRSYHDVWVENMMFFKNGQKKIFSYELYGKETKKLPLCLDIEIPDFIKKKNLSSDEFLESCKELLSFKIASLELGKTTLKSNILGYVVQSEHYELRGVLRVFAKDDKAKEALLTLQEQFNDQNQTLLELTEFERNIKG